MPKNAVSCGHRGQVRPGSACRRRTSRHPSGHHLSLMKPPQMQQQKAPWCCRNHGESREKPTSEFLLDFVTEKDLLLQSLNEGTVKNHWVVLCRYMERRNILVCSKLAFPCPFVIFKSRAKCSSLPSETKRQEIVRFLPEPHLRGSPFSKWHELWICCYWFSSLGTQHTGDSAVPQTVF